MGAKGCPTTLRGKKNSGANYEYDRNQIKRGWNLVAALYEKLRKRRERRRKKSAAELSGVDRDMATRRESLSLHVWRKMGELV